MTMILPSGARSTKWPWVSLGAVVSRESTICSDISVGREAGKTDLYGVGLSCNRGGWAVAVAVEVREKSAVGRAELEERI